MMASLPAPVMRVEMAMMASLPELPSPSAGVDTGNNGKSARATQLVERAEMVNDGKSASSSGAR